MSGYLRLDFLERVFFWLHLVGPPDLVDTGEMFGCQAGLHALLVSEEAAVGLLQDGFHEGTVVVGLPLAVKDRLGLDHGSRSSCDQLF